MNKINLSFTQNELNLVIMGLGKLPLEQVAQLYTRIQNDFNKAMEESRLQAEQAQQKKFEEKVKEAVAERAKEETTESQVTEDGK